MHTFNIQSSVWNHACVSGLISNLFHIMHNIHTVIDILHRVHGYSCGIYLWLILIYIRIGTKTFCGGGARSEYK